MPQQISLPIFRTINPQSLPHKLETLLQKNLSHIENLLKQDAYTWDNLMNPLEEIDNEIEQCWASFSHLHSVHNTDEMRSIYEQCLPLLTDYETHVGQHEGLYRAIRSISTNSLTATQKKIIQDTLKDFELAGVHLPAEKKQRYQVIEERLSELQSRFENHLIDAELAFELPILDASRLAGLPVHTVQAAKARAEAKKMEGWILTIDPPCYLAVMTNGKDRALRETLYQAYITRASDAGPQAGQFDNTPLMQEILTLRHELSQLLGFNTFADLSLETKMALHVKEVMDFLMDLQKRVCPQAKEEFKTLQDFARAHFKIEQLAPWDLSFISEQYKQAQFSFSEESLRFYFKESSVWTTLEMILHKLYGVRLTELKEVDKWHPLVRCFQVTHEDNSPVGYLYVDLFARPYKRTGAWMDSLRTHMKKRDQSIQLPIATLTCNFAPPQDNEEATFLHDDLITLLHEMGHCLHHILTQVEEYSAAGINGVEWDTVELPSQFFEHWGWDKQLLTHFTQSAMPADLIQHLLNSQTFLSGMSLLRQLELSLFDLQLHHTPPGTHPEWIKNILAQIRQTTCFVSVVPYNRFENSFSHIFAGGYAAGYYSYLWAEILSSDCFSKFEEAGILDPKTGQAFLREILARGSSRSARENFEGFMGRAPKMDAFLRHRGIRS